MSHSKKPERPSAAFLARFLLPALLALLVPLHALAAPAPDDIVFVSVKGEVRVTAGGRTQDAREGSILELPASLRTGNDGSADLRQGETTIAVGPDTQLDFPVAAVSGGPVDRVSQAIGNAYYKVGPQGARRLRVETPYLVAVIKGTQFNVAVTADSSTISLHEGRLEILATEENIPAIELNAGEVAVRKSGEKTIRVLKINGSGATSNASPRVGDQDGTDEEVTAYLPSGNGDRGNESPHDDFPPADDIGDIFGPGLPDSPANTFEGGVTVGAEGGIEGVGDVQLGAEADLDLGAGTAGAILDAGVDLGTVSADASADVGLDLGTGTIDAGVDAGVDLGTVSADASADVGIDLGSGTVEAGVDAGIDLGTVSADASVDAGADLGSGTVDAGIGADVAGAEAGVDVGVDLAGEDAGIDLGVGVLGTEIDLGIGGDAAGGEGSGAESRGPGGLLGGILGRPRS